MSFNRLCLIALTFTTVPLLAFANSHEIIQGGLVPCDGLDCDWEDFVQLANNIIRFLISVILIGSVGVFAYAGFRYMTALGDEQKIKQAHEMFKKVVWGLILALVAWLLVDVLLSLLTGRGGLNDWLNFIKADNFSP